MRNQGGDVPNKILRIVRKLLGKCQLFLVVMLLLELRGAQSTENLTVVWFVQERGVSQDVESSVLKPGKPK